MTSARGTGKAATASFTYNAILKNRPFSPPSGTNPNPRLFPPPRSIQKRASGSRSLGLGLARHELEAGTDPALEFVRQVLQLLEDRWHF